ncbi:hypothetical protein BC941DRAFT_427615 [Chlamydoabsidia padenii]|nr:hypothetical protein BC941DRAFT_427615 [Chlamydoabsidia padenii]
MGRSKNINRQTSPAPGVHVTTKSPIKKKTPRVQVHPDIIVIDDDPLPSSWPSNQSGSDLYKTDDPYQWTLAPLKPQSTLIKTIPPIPMNYSRLLQSRPTTCTSHYKLSDTIGQDYIHLGKTGTSSNSSYGLVIPRIRQFDDLTIRRDTRPPAALKRRLNPEQLKAHVQQHTPTYIKSLKTLVKIENDALQIKKRSNSRRTSPSPLVIPPKSHLGQLVYLTLTNKPDPSSTMITRSFFESKQKLVRHIPQIVTPRTSLYGDTIDNVISLISDDEEEDDIANIMTDTRISPQLCTTFEYIILSDDEDDDHSGPSKENTQSSIMEGTDVLYGRGQQHRQIQIVPPSDTLISNMSFINRATVCPCTSSNCALVHSSSVHRYD